MVSVWSGLPLAVVLNKRGQSSDDDIIIGLQYITGTRITEQIKGDGMTLAMDRGYITSNINVAPGARI